MNEIKLLQDNRSILEKDKELIERIKELFEYNEDTNLVPQCFWGNIKDPKIIILAKNPSHVASDDLDNKYFSKTLINNLKIENREDIINMLFSCTSIEGIPFELSGVSKWWRSFFDENINSNNKDSFMSDKCIINLCGYYKTNLAKNIDEELYWFYDKNKENNINDIIDNVFKNNNLEKIITVWSKNNNPWIKVLKKLGISKDKIDQADKKNPYQPYLKSLNQC